MAGNTADVILPMQGVCRFHVLGGGGVASKAAGIDFPGCVIGEDEDLGFVTPSCNVSSAGSVTAFASLVGGATLGVEGSLPMWGLFPGIVDFLVAGFAHFGAEVIGTRSLRLWRRLSGDRRERLFGVPGKCGGCRQEKNPTEDDWPESSAMRHRAFLRTTLIIRESGEMKIPNDVIMKH